MVKNKSLKILCAFTVIFILISHKKTTTHKGKYKSKMCRREVIKTQNGLTSPPATHTPTLENKEKKIIKALHTRSYFKHKYNR